MWYLRLVLFRTLSGLLFSHSVMHGQARRGELRILRLVFLSACQYTHPPMHILNLN
jgi:hypothetical protein